MKKLRNFIFSICSLVSFVILGPMLVNGYSLCRALINGYSIERPLYSLLAIILVAIVLYRPMWKAKDMFRFDMAHEFDSAQRLIFGGLAMCFITCFSEISQMHEFGYDNPIILWLFNGWFIFVMSFFALVILIFGFGVGRTD